MLCFGSGRGLDRWFSRAIFACAAAWLLGMPGPSAAQTTEVNVYPTLDQSFVGPQLAVNPTNPNNIVLAATADTGYTQACIAAVVPGSPCELVPRPGIPGIAALAPRGYMTPGFLVKGMFVSFDRGATWTKVDISGLRPAGHPELYSINEGGFGVTADGTFYLQWNALDWGDWLATPPTFVPNAAIAVSKSTDGGLTWSVPTISNPPTDFPYLAIDKSDGTVYSMGGLGAITPLGPRSTGDPNSPILTPFGDAFVAASADGVTWTPAQRTGGTDGVTQFTGATGKDIAAANGVAATVHFQTTAAACAFFLGGGAAAPCVVFQTSTDAGATWTRQRVPAPYAPTALEVAADPSTPGHYTVVTMPSDRSRLDVWQTLDTGNTWSGPKAISQDVTKTGWNPWIAYSLDGVFGMVWRTNELAPYPALSPYSIWAATSEDGGLTFHVRKVSNGSPAAKTTPFTGLSGNIPQDRSAIALHGRNVYVAWGDWRTGERNLVFSAFTLPVNGDLNDDGVVDAADYQLIRSSLGKCSGAPGFVVAADLDANGCVDYRDYQSWYAIYRSH
ncbi:MAG TPA: dockerin type I domain-containing protein [Myxococcota bacterium]|nr:dockerin type I domain-containing protein [Myxococcota bacterium]